MRERISQAIDLLGIGVFTMAIMFAYAVARLFGIETEEE